MAIATIIIGAATTAYTLLEAYVFGPDRTAGNAKSVFNHADFPRIQDKYGRSINSIFTKIVKRGHFTDKAAYYAGYDGTESNWARWLQPGLHDAIISAHGGRKKEILHGIVDKSEHFNADSLFELYGFMQWWHGGTKAKEIFFDNIINPMYNLSLRNNWQLSHRFTAPDRRFWMPISDYFLLQQYAEAPTGVNTYTVFYDKGRKSKLLDKRNTAIAFLSILKKYPFTSGYFVDGLSNDKAIIERENFLFSQIINNTHPLASPLALAHTPLAHTQTHTITSSDLKTTVGTKSFKPLYLVFMAAGIIALALIIKIFKKIKNK